MHIEIPKWTNCTTFDMLQLAGILQSNMKKDIWYMYKCVPVCIIAGKENKIKWNIILKKN